MDRLPSDLIDDILFRLDPVSVSTMRCTNRFLRTYISDPKFDSYRFSGIGHSLFSIACYVTVTTKRNFVINGQYVCSVCISDQPCGPFYILGSCSGLLLLYTGGLFIANPFTKRFRRLDHSGSKIIHEIVTSVSRNTFTTHEIATATVRRNTFTPHERAMCVGFAVDRIQNRTTKRFKIVCILEMQTMYGFEIYDGHSWRLSKTTISTSSESELSKRMKPVYLNGNLHWLRNDGSIIAFNPETEQASFIPCVFYQEPKMELFFAPDDKINCLTLVSGTKEEISVYILTENAEWVLDKNIKNIFMEKSDLHLWDVVMYDGERLVVMEKNMNLFKCVVHVYDMEANSWGVLGSGACLTRRIFFYKFTPSLSFVEEDQEQKKTIACRGLVSYLTEVMGLIDSDTLSLSECPIHNLEFET